MTVWLDAQLSPRLARWLAETFNLTALSVRDAGLRDAEDAEIFSAAQKAADVVITKDSDFVELPRTPRPAAENHLAHLRQHFRRRVEVNPFIGFTRSRQAFGSRR